MKTKDIKLFEKTIHEVKKVVVEIKKERDSHNNEFKILRKLHNKEMKKHMKQLINIINELYELFEDLSNGKGK